jgi:hypothetical protein
MPIIPKYRPALSAEQIVFIETVCQQLAQQSPQLAESPILLSVLKVFTPLRAKISTGIAEPAFVFKKQSLAEKLGWDTEPHPARLTCTDSRVQDINTLHRLAFDTQETEQEMQRYLNNQMTEEEEAAFEKKQLGLS